MGTHILNFQESVEEIQKRSEQSLSQNRESFSSQLRQLELAKDKLETRSARLKEELNTARSQEAHLKSLVADLGKTYMFMYMYFVLQLLSCYHYAPLLVTM